MDAKEIREILKAKGISPLKSPPFVRFVSSDHRIGGDILCHAYVGWTNRDLSSGFLVVTTCSPVGEILKEEFFPVYRSLKGFVIDVPSSVVEFEFERG